MSKCNKCKGRGYFKVSGDDPSGFSFDVLLDFFNLFFTVIILTIAGAITFVLQLFGIISLKNLKVNNWFVLIGGVIFIFYILIASIYNVWRMIFPKKLPCKQCNGSGVIDADIKT